MQFRKKPVVIEAMQHSTRGGLTDALVDFLGGEAARNIVWSYVAGKIYITTLEGQMSAQPGDWIVKGIKGELYPVKPDIFKATYEPVSASPEEP
jgi:hypothetical protein